jgi:quercetin dioxygenase-like cupin family protein
MPDATIKRVDEMETFYDGMVTRARAELGVTSWGMQLFNFPPGFDAYPNHNHAEGAVDPGQEELYIPIAGSATLQLDGEEHRLEPGVWARVGMGQLRRVVPGPDGLRVIVIGGTPGRAFVPPAWTELGADPPQMPD